MEKVVTSDLKLGIIAGGQLGKMLIQDASKWDVISYVLDPEERCPAGSIASHLVQGDYRDYGTVLNFGRQVDVLTYEIEAINVEALRALKAEGRQVVPDPEILGLIQDKGRQKAFYQAHHLPTANFQFEIMKSARVSVVMGSDSDLPVMRAAADQLSDFGVACEVDIVSAHRTPDKLFQFSSEAHARGIDVIIAGAGGAAHLPGMVAALSPLPVIGVPIKSSNSIDGWDSVLSILQMPAGVPVATVALNGARNAGILAAQILSANAPDLRQRLITFKQQLRSQVLEKADRLKH